VNTEQAKEIIGEEHWEKFLVWMTGQTVGIYPDGSTDFYKFDVERFAESNRPEGTQETISLEELKKEWGLE